MVMLTSPDHSHIFPFSIGNFPRIYNKIHFSPEKNNCSQHWKGDYSVKTSQSTNSFKKRKKMCRTLNSWVSFPHTKNVKIMIVKLAFKPGFQACPCQCLILIELVQKWTWPPAFFPFFQNSPGKSSAPLTKQGWRSLVKSVLFSTESHS